MWITLKEFFCLTSRLNPALEILQAFLYCLIFKVLCPALLGVLLSSCPRDSLFSISYWVLFVNHFFKLFWICFLCPATGKPAAFLKQVPSSTNKIKGTPGNSLSAFGNRTLIVTFRAVAAAASALYLLYIRSVPPALLVAPRSFS